jgi:hypothetical protein
MTANQPVAPPPSRSRRKVVEPPPVEAPAAEPATPEFFTGPTPSTEVAHPGVVRADYTVDGRALAEALAAPTRPAAAQQQAPAAPSSYAAFMGLNRHVDPDNDLGTGPNRLPKYVLAAITLIAASTGKSRQTIVAEAITGKTPIPDVVLDEAFRELYGYPRPPVR